MAVPTVISAPESLFEIPRYNNHYMEKNRFCEFKHPEDPSFFVPAAIVRQRKIFVFIHLEAEKRFTLPMIYPAKYILFFSINH